MIVVTGGAGFIGSNVVHALGATRNDRIVVADWPDAEKAANLVGADVWQTVSPDALFAFLGDHAKDVSAVVHMGANASTTDPEIDLVFHYNLDFSARLFDWCAGHGCRLVYASSAATYGEGAAGFEDRGDLDHLKRLRPLNAYAMSKHAFDMAVTRRIAGGGTRPPQWAGLKFFNVYGPREDHKGDMRSLVAKMVPQILEGRTVNLFRSHRPDCRDGEQMRDFVHVGDCVGVVQWLLANEGVSGLFNVGSGRARSFLDLARATFAALDRAPDIAFVDMPEAIRDRYQYFTKAPLAKLRAAGYGAAMMGLEDGVGAYVRGHLVPRLAGR